MLWTKITTGMTQTSFIFYMLHKIRYIEDDLVELTLAHFIYILYKKQGMLKTVGLIYRVKHPFIFYIKIRYVKYEPIFTKYCNIIYILHNVDKYCIHSFHCKPIWLS